MTHIKRLGEMLAQAQTMKGKGEIILPSFSGFYESFWTDYTDDDLIDVTEFEKVMGHEPEHLNEWKIDWETYKNELGTYYVKKVQYYYENVFSSDFSLKYNEITSPKYYNYTTDKMYATLTIENTTEFCNELIELINNNMREFTKLIEKNHSSRSGFISFMEHDVNSWISSIRELDYQYIGYAMYYLYTIESGENLESEITYDALDDMMTCYAYMHPGTEEAKLEYDEFCKKL